MTYDDYMKVLQEKILSYLEKGEIPWQKPWLGARNGSTNREYHGINRLMLSMVADNNHDGDPRYYTFDQAKKLGYGIPKGSKSVPAFFFKIPETFIPKRDEEGNKVKDEEGNQIFEVIRGKPVFQVYHLFNAKQLENVPELELNSNKSEVNTDLAMEFASSMEVPIHYDSSSRACYIPSKDEIHLPNVNNFFSTEGFVSTLLHEVSHSSGHEKRLKRDLSGLFGNEPYAKEELIAEMSAVFLCEKANMQYANANSAAYIGSWMNAFKSKDFDLSSIYKEVNQAVLYISNPAEREKLYELNHKPFEKEKTSSNRRSR